MKKIIIIALLVTMIGVVFAYGIDNVPSQNLTINDGACVSRNINLTFRYTNVTESLLVRPTIDLPYFSNSISPKWFYVNLNSTHTQETLPITYKICVPNHYQYGTYYGKLFLYVSDSTNESTASHLYHTDLIVNVPLRENITFIYSNNTINKSTGSNGTFCININNTGNKEQEYNMSIIQSIFSDIYYPQYLIARIGETHFCFKYRIIDNITGVHIVKVKFIDDQTKDVNIKFNITDSIPPKINAVSYPDKIYANRGFTLYVNATDNIGIKSVEANVCGDNKRLYSDKNGLYSRDFIINKTETCPIVVEVKDVSGHTTTKYLNVTPNFLNDLSISKNIKNPKQKVGTNYTFDLWKLGKEREVKIKVVDAYMIVKNGTNGTASISRNKIHLSLLSDRGKVSVVKGQEIEVLTSKLIGVVSCDDMGNYEIKMNYVFPKDVTKDNVVNQTITGECADYSVAKPYNGKILGYDIRCYPQDTGIYQTSKYMCTISYPIDTNIENANLMFPKSLFDNMKNYYENRIDELTNQNNSLRKRLKWTYIIGISLVVLAVLGYFVYDKMLTI